MRSDNHPDGLGAVVGGLDPQSGVFKVDRHQPPVVGAVFGEEDAPLKRPIGFSPGPVAV